MTHKVLLVVLAVTVSAEVVPTYSAPQHPYEPPEHTYHDPDHDDPNYSFQWKVDDQYAGNYYGHEETRDGYDTEGSYYVRLPDGRLMTVNYEVHGDSGFLADVNYEGEAHYPTYPNEPTYKPHPTYEPAGPIHEPDPISHSNLDLFGRTHPRLIAK